MRSGAYCAQMNSGNVGNALAAIAASPSRTSWGAIAKIPADTLVRIGRTLAEVRRAHRKELDGEATKLAREHATFVREALEARIDSPARSKPGNEVGRAAPRVIGNNTNNPWLPDPKSDPRLTAASLKPSFREALNWARVRDPQRADKLASLAREVIGVVGAPVDLMMVDEDQITDGVVASGPISGDWTDTLVDGFVERITAEWCGRLHLERIDMTPVAILRGELLHSVGLAPKEEITLIHREWSSRTTTFDKAVTEEFEQSREESVTESTELASATETQSRYSSALSVNATASGSYGFASASLTIGYETGSEDETAKRDSRNHSVEVTNKAASRTRKEHKVTFTVKEEAGVLDETVRKLSNASATDAMRVDFHQLLRQWKVDLYRYGVRQTFDIVVPAPGIDLLTKIDEINRIDHMLSQPFYFPVVPGDITRSTWSDLAARHGGRVEAPNPETISLQQTFTYPTPASAEEASEIKLDVIAFDVPEGYRVQRGFLRARILFFYNAGEEGYIDIQDDWTEGVGQQINGVHWLDSALELLIGRSGHVDILMDSRYVRNGFVQATLDVTETPETFVAWQNRAWTQMREGAEERYQTTRGELRQRREQLAQEIDQWDPLTLRKMEREEVMKTTLRWLFGPFFDLTPIDVMQLYGGDPGGLAALDPAQLSPEQWAKVMGMGEFIKFLQQAIEWENVLFFVYPYFWDHPRNQVLKRFLRHPDSIHQAFLRGGAARVVLTVRPGFEKEFSTMVETAVPDGIIDDVDNPYLTIAEEIRNYSETNYPGIPGGDESDAFDEEEIDDARRGRLIARWYDYTPVSALDITVNAPLSDLH